MGSKKWLETPEKLCVLGSLLHFVVSFRNKDLVCRYHTLLWFYFMRYASTRAPPPNTPVQSPVALSTDTFAGRQVKWDYVLMTI